MRRLLLALLLVTSLAATAKTSFPFAGSTVELLDRAEAARLNGQSDGYTRALTPFDLSIRLKQVTGATEAGYLAAAAKAVEDWPAAEAQQLRAAFDSIAAFAAARGLNFHLPATIQLIKSDCSQEFGAEGYTRGTRIMLNTAAQPLSPHLVAHELFHVISRANPALRDRAYAVFGFQPCNRIDLRKSVPQAITNPDCPVLEHFIAQPGTGTAYTLLLYSKIPYTAGAGFGDYVNVGLLELAEQQGVRRPATDAAGKPRILDLESAPWLFAQVGMNTPYLLHPEEISAEHFAMLVTGASVKEPQYLDRLEAALRP